MTIKLTMKMNHYKNTWNSSALVYHIWVQSFIKETKGNYYDKYFFVIST